MGIDHGRLTTMALRAREATCEEDLTVGADRGDFRGAQIVNCDAAGITTYVPRPLPSGTRAEGRFGIPDFVHIPRNDEYRCPAGQ